MTLRFKVLMKMRAKTINIIKSKEGGFTLIELVTTIILIGIMSVGLYNVILFGINGYMTSENYLHSNNSMTYAISALRRNLVDAAVYIKSISPSGSAYCTLSAPINPASAGNEPVVVANLAGQTTSCGGAGEPPCNEVAFYQNITVGQQLVVFCVNSNDILYEEVTDSKGVTTSYPAANNINIINIPISATPSYCYQNAASIYSCNINFDLTSVSTYSGITYNGRGGVSVIVANPQ